MDSVTQFVLGASIGGAMLGRTIGVRALVLGGAAATMPDLDSLIPLGNAIDDMTYHRGVTHSVLVQTAVTPVVAFAIARMVRDLRGIPKQVFLTVWLCFITHSILDSLTTYGTQILWPLPAGPPAAFPVVFIIDPLYTLILTAGVVIFALRRFAPDRGVRATRIMLAASTVYLTLGAAGHMVVRARAEATPAFKGMRVHVQPTPFNILFWQVLAVGPDNYRTGLTSIIPACPVFRISIHPRLAAPPGDVEVSDSVRRLEWFTDGFYSYHDKGEALAITDLRIGFHPTYVFSFEFARKNGSGYDDVTPVQTGIGPGGGARLSGVFGDLVENISNCRPSPRETAVIPAKAGSRGDPVRS